MDKDDHRVSISVRSDIFEQLIASREQRRRREQSENHGNDVSDDRFCDFRAGETVVDVVDNGHERRHTTSEGFHPRRTVRPPR